MAEKRSEQGLSWKVKHALSTVSKEIHKTKMLGARMVEATKVNSSLNQTYIELGRLVEVGLRSGNLQWDNGRALELLGQIEQAKINMASLEDDLTQIKQKAQAAHNDAEDVSQ